MADEGSTKEDDEGEKSALEKLGIYAADGDVMSSDRDGEGAGRRERESEPTDWADFSNDYSTSTGGSSLSKFTVAGEKFDAGQKIEAVPQTLLGAGESGFGIMNRGPPQNERSSNSDWAQFSPTVTSSHSLPGASLDTSQWAQDFTSDGAGSGDNPLITRISTERKTSSVGTSVSGSDWQVFSRGSDSSRDYSNSLSTDETPHPMYTVAQDTNTPSEESTLRVCSAQPHHPCVRVFRQCFHARAQQRGSDDTSSGDCATLLVSTECAQDWGQLGDSSFAASLWRWAQTSLHHPPPSTCMARLAAVMNPELEFGQLGPGSLAFPPGDEEGFDWMHPNQRRRAMSPDVVPNLFRPRKESLVDVNFDHDRAASGLAVLSVDELRQMCDEMSSKFSWLSEELITGLQCRDVMAGEVEAKNRFVSALLRVQQLRHSQDTNGGLGESGRGRQWSWGHKKREDEPSGMYLQTVIPYKLPEGLKWRTDTLAQLTKVLKAIAEGSNTVPRLMSEYLQAEFMTSPSADRQSFDSSLSSDRNHKLSTLSV